MNESCRRKPFVFNKQGKQIESQLYNDMVDLMSHIGKGERSKVLPLYERTLDPQFIKDMKNNGALFDEYGDVSLYDYWKTFDNGKEISEEILLKFLNEKEKFFTGTVKKIFTDKKELFEQISKFNDNQLWSRAYIATFKSESRPGSEPRFTAEIIPITDNNRDLLRQYKQFMQNSLYMSYSLKHAGISTDAYDRLESKVTNGYTDFSKIDEFSKELKHTLEILNNNAVGKITSKFMEFILGSMINAPLVIRALNVLKENDNYRQFLHNPDESESYYNGNKQLLAIEALSNILSDNIKTNLLSDTVFKGLNGLAKNVFNKINPDNIIVNDEKSSSLKKLKVDHTATKTIWDKFFDITLRRQTIYSKRKKELNLTEEDEETKESILTEQGELLQMLDVAAHNDWTNPIVEVDLDDNVEYKTKEEYRVDAAIKLIDVAIKDTERIKDITYKLKESINNGTYKGSINSACAKVRAIMDYIESYEQIFNNIEEILDEAFNDPALNSYPEIDTIRQQLRDQAHGLKETLNKIKREVLPDNKNYDIIKKGEKEFPLAITVLLKGMSDFIPEGAGLAIGTGVNGQVMSLEELLMYSDSDIAGASAWLNSMANTSDEIARIYDHIVKRQKDEARQECLEDIRKIKAAGEKLDESKFKIRQHKFMYKYDDVTIKKEIKDDKIIYWKIIDNDVDGAIKVSEKEFIEAKQKSQSKTNKNSYSYTELSLDNLGRPRYITDYDKAAARKASKKYKQSLYVKYRNLSDAEKLDAINKDYNDWLDEHYEIRRGRYYPKASYFPSKEYNNLTDKEKQFYNTFMEIKRKYDSYIPLNTNDSSTAIIVRKEGIAKLLALSKDFNLKDQIKDWFRNTFSITATDDEFGTSPTIQNFKGQEVKKIPIYYTSIDKDANLNTYSMNCVANLCLYAKTASNYKALSKVIETLELGRDVLAQRKTHKKNNKGNNELDRITKDYAYIDNQKSTNFNKRLDKFMDMTVYGELHKSKYAKHTSILSRVIGLFTTATNVLVGLTNIIQGIGQINIEMLADEHINPGSVIKANWIYFRNILKVIYDLGAPNQTSKLGLFSEDFNVMQEFEGSVKNMNQYERNKILRAFEIFNPYILNHIGEHYMQHITAIALAVKTKIKTSDDKEVSLWDAYEIVPIDPDRPRLGSRLKLKEYTNKNGIKSQTYYTLDEKQIVSIEQLTAEKKFRKEKFGKNIDLHSKSLVGKNKISEYEFKGNFSRKAAKLNQDMHGIYNEDDKNMLQQYAIGGLVMMYRKHIVPNFMKRFKNEWYDYDLDTKTSGYLRPDLYQKTIFKKLFGTTETEDNKKKWSILVMTPKERGAFFRATGQLFNWILINVAISCMEAFADDDDSMSWWYAVVLTSLYRGKTENAQFEPLAIFSKHSLINEWWRLAEQPIVGFSVMERIANAKELFDPESYTHVITKGPYKDMTKAEKTLYQIIPGFNQIKISKKPPLDYFRQDVGEAWYTKWIHDSDDEGSRFIWNMFDED